jgi:hypothetical protein
MIDNAIGPGRIPVWQSAEIHLAGFDRTLYIQRALFVATAIVTVDSTNKIPTTGGGNTL